MARIRSIKPDFFKSETLQKLDKLTRLTFIGLWTYVDDNGVGLDSERLIAAELYALESDFMNEIEGVKSDLIDLEQAGLIRRYAVAGKRLLFVSGWDEHQKISHPGKPRYWRPMAGSRNPPGIHPGVSGGYPETLRSLTGVSSETLSGGGNEATPDDSEVPGDDFDTQSSSANETAGQNTLRKSSRRSPETLQQEQGAGSREQGKGKNLSPSAGADEGAGNPKPKTGSRKAKPKEHPRFAEFWDAYGHKVERLAAVKAFNQAAEDGADLDAVIAAAGRYARRCKRLGLDRHKIKHASGWLNGERWNDELDDDTPVPAGANLAPHCGHCDPVDRTLLTLENTLEPCPKCHPDRTGARR